jgi:hypothetical protein
MTLKMKQIPARPIPSGSVHPVHGDEGSIARLIPPGSIQLAKAADIDLVAILGWGCWVMALLA